MSRLSDSIFTLEGPNLRGLAMAPTANPFGQPQLLGPTGIQVVDDVIEQIQNKFQAQIDEVKARIRTEATSGARAAIPEIRAQVHTEAKKAVMPIVVIGAGVALIGSGVIAGLVARRVARRAR